VLVETSGRWVENRGPGLAQDERRRIGSTLDTSEIGRSGGASLNKAKPRGDKCR